MNDKYIDIIDIDTVVPRYEKCGPLLLDDLESLASVNGEVLLLTEDEYNALYLLARLRGQCLSFERLYASVWERFDGQDDGRETARRGMNNIVKSLNKAGKGIMRIDVLPEQGYTLWLKDEKEPKKRQPWHIGIVVLIACAVVTFLALLMMPLFHPFYYGTTAIEDELVPLAVPDYGNEIVYPSLESQMKE